MNVNPLQTRLIYSEEIKEVVVPSHGQKQDPEFEIYPQSDCHDVRSFKRKFALLIPATNTSMESQLWNIIYKNQNLGELTGVGLNTSNVLTTRPQLQTEQDLVAL